MSRDNKAQKSTYSDPETRYTNRTLTMTLHGGYRTYKINNIKLNLKTR